MKQYLVLGMFGLMGACDANDRANIPSVVENALKEKFPNASKIDWDRVNAAYEAEFDASSGEHTIEIDTSGKIRRVKIDIKDSLLPAHVKMGLDSMAPGAKLSDVEILELADNTYFQVELKVAGKQQKFVVDSSGRVKNEIKYWD
jgi:uncharacterized membrane protein YkoI